MKSVVDTHIQMLLTEPVTLDVVVCLARVLPTLTPRGTLNVADARGRGELAAAAALLAHLKEGDG